MGETGRTGAKVAPACRVEPLRWRDPKVADIPMPKGRLRLTRSVGSGLAWDGARLWGLGDRGPNLKVDLAFGNYGLEALKRLEDMEGAKIMPAPELGPEITALDLTPGRVVPGPALRIVTPAGRPLPGLPLPGGDSIGMEPAFDLEGARLGADPDGADTEGLAAAPDGGFWVAEEYGPSLLRVDADGVARARFVPVGTVLAGAEIPQHATLPALAARRRLNRGFEGVTMSADGARLIVAFQSALQIGEDIPRHARLWVIDPATGEVTAQYLYPFDPPRSFLRDRGDNPGDGGLKICDLAVLPDGGLLILERISKSARIYLVDLETPLPAAHLDPATRPSLEEMSPATLVAAGLSPVTKTLILDSDVHDVIAADLARIAVIAADVLILATDNDFGIEGAETRFFRVTFDRPLTDYPRSPA